MASPNRRTARRRPPPNRPPQHTSSSTSRAAYAETRRWLLQRHGPVCAYCGNRFSDDEMTLDHVTPRRGQSAYDRRDNLVLACPACNAAKADMPVLAFLLRRRERAAHLARYGDHLSGMLLDLARQIAGPDSVPGVEETAPRARIKYAELEGGDGESPYRDSPYGDEGESPYRE